jgi:predicted ester cyclase
VMQSVVSADPQQPRLQHQMTELTAPAPRSQHPRQQLPRRNVSPMSPAEMKELVRQIMEDGFNAGDIAVVYRSFAEDYVRHGVGVPSMRSLAEHVADLQLRLEAFEDARFEIRDMVAESDTVAVRYTFHGTHTGEFMGIAPTGRTVQRPSAAFFRIAGGKVVEGNVFADGAAMVAELTAPT